jgi:hypothetical protein
VRFVGFLLVDIGNMHGQTHFLGLSYVLVVDRKPAKRKWQ